MARGAAFSAQPDAALLVEDRKRYLGVADERIEAPLIVIGFPRSGTTSRLRRFIAQHPAGCSGDRGDSGPNLAMNRRRTSPFQAGDAN